MEVWGQVESLLQEVQGTLRYRKLQALVKNDAGAQTLCPDLLARLSATQNRPRVLFPEVSTPLTHFSHPRYSPLPLAPIPPTSKAGNLRSLANMLRNSL